MWTRRQFVARTLKGSSLIALGALVPRFVTAAAREAEPGKDTVLVVLEMTGGNDGLNTVIPYADDLYHKARPTLRHTREQVVRVDDHIGLNPGMRSFEGLLGKGQLAIVQGVGYPNPDRSHFESMDVWQSADPTRKVRSGWLGRGLGTVRGGPGHIPGVYVGTEQLPLALQGSATGVPTIHYSKPYDLELAGLSETRRGYYSPSLASGLGGTTDSRLEERRRLIEDLARLPAGPGDDMLQFVQRSSLETYSTIERLRKILGADRPYQAGYRGRPGALAENLTLVARMIAAEFGTRIFYVSIGGFDTHAEQQQQHQQLLQQLADAVTNFFTQLEQSGHARRVLLLTFSEFGRRVQENGSKGTDHGAGSCLFVAGPGVRGGPVGAHPSLSDLDAGDLKHHTDFRQVYATLLGGWLGCDSRRVLGGTFTPLPLLRQA